MARSNRLSDEQKIALVAAFTRGDKPLMISQRLGISAPTVYNYKNEWEAGRMVEFETSDTAAQQMAPVHPKESEPADQTAVQAASPTGPATAERPPDAGAPPEPEHEENHEPPAVRGPVTPSPLESFHALRGDWLRRRDDAQRAVDALDTVIGLYGEG